MSAQLAYEAAEGAYRNAKPLFAAWLAHRDAPEGIRKLYEKGYVEYLRLRAEKAKLAGAAYRERNNVQFFATI